MNEKLIWLRSNGWAVAVHNDYRLNGEAHTFWLFTKGDRSAKGEGLTDNEALAQVMNDITSERFQHVKRGSCYDVLSREATAQSDIKEGQKVWVYIDDKGNYHVREKGQSEDGRFIRWTGAGNVQRQPVEGEDLSPMPLCVPSEVRGKASKED